MREEQQIDGNAAPGHAALTLLDIASWHSKPLAPGKHPSIVAGIASLQRGAVWNAGQVELLWDSMMRGFPVGSLVLCINCRPNRRVPTCSIPAGRPTK